MSPSLDFRLTRVSRLFLVVGAMFSAAGGYVHLREWLDTYRHIPAAVTGSEVVRLGFPVNAAISALAAIALLVCAVRVPKWAPLVAAGAALFQASSLIILFASRTSNVFGWSETTWTMGASQTRAVEIGALLALGTVVVLDTIRRNAMMRAALVRASA